MRLVNVLRVATLYVCVFERKRFFMLSPSYPIGAEKRNMKTKQSTFGKNRNETHYENSGTNLKN